MKCIGNCNQGRTCTCATSEPKVHLLEVIVILLMISVAVVCAVLEFTVTGSARWTEFTVVALAVLTAFGFVIYWLAGRVIAAIDFMTRCE